MNSFDISETEITNLGSRKFQKIVSSLVIFEIEIPGMDAPKMEWNAKSKDNFFISKLAKIAKIDRTACKHFCFMLCFSTTVSTMVITKFTNM